MSKIPEKFINHLQQQILFLRKQLRNKDKDHKLINKPTLEQQ